MWPAVSPDGVRDERERDDSTATGRSYSSVEKICLQRNRMLVKIIPKNASVVLGRRPSWGDGTSSSGTRASSRCSTRVAVAGIHRPDTT